MESAEKPFHDLHQKLHKPLEQLGHSGPTIPPQEDPVFAKDTAEWIEATMKEHVTGGATYIRGAKAKKGLGIVQQRVNKKAA